MKTKLHFRSPRNTARRLVRNAAVAERRRRLAFWQFYREEEQDATPSGVIGRANEPSAR